MPSSELGGGDGVVAADEFDAAMFWLSGSPGSLLVGQGMSRGD